MLQQHLSPEALAEIRDPASYGASQRCGDAMRDRRVQAFETASARPPQCSAWSLISNAEPSLDLVWSYGRRFCCEQLFRDQKSGCFPLAGSGLRDPQRMDRLLLVVAIAVLAGSLQGYALSLAGHRRQVDPHWKHGMSFLRLGLGALQMHAADTTASLMTWLPIPLQDLEPCIPSRRSRQTQAQAWFSRIELPPRPQAPTPRKRQPTIA